MQTRAFGTAARTAEPTEPRYASPALVVLGDVRELTLAGSRAPNLDICIWNKTIGPPDYWTCIPISNCS